MRKIVTKASADNSSTTASMTTDEAIKLVTVRPRNQGLQRAAAKLREAYGSRPYEEVDRDLNVIKTFKKNRHLLSYGAEKVLMELNFLKEPVLPNSAASGDEVPPTASMTSTAPYQDVPVPSQESIATKTLEDLLNPSPQTRLAKEDTSKQTLRRPIPKGRPHRGAVRNDDKSSPRPMKIAEMRGNRVQVTSADRYPLTPLSMKTSEVPKLCHDLSRVLFNPGVYQLQDPRSRVWNFDPYLGNLMPVSEFNYDALNKYITSSEDVHLREVAQQRGKRYIGSTSSMSGILSHFHFLLSAFRDLTLTNLSRGFDDGGQTQFTKIQKGPAAIFLRYRDGVYAVDADKEFDSANILMSLGRSMEKLLTSDKEEFERYRRSEDSEKDAQMKSSQPEAYHYSGLAQFLLRSQLDAYDPRLPGTGMFDLKTRAVAAVRMMVRDHEKGVGYQIKDRFGTWESYEREYYDMMRAAFLKYSLQVRMGRMDGIFVAYHNTERLFGFQYVPITEMDFALHGQSDRTLGDQEFSLSMQMLNTIFNEATMQHPGQSLRFHFETRPATSAASQYMYVFAEPVTEDEIVAIQNLKKDEIRAFEERIFNPRSAGRSEDHKGGSDEVDLETESGEIEGADGSGASLSDQDSEPVSQQSNAANVEFLDSILGIDLKEAITPRSKEITDDDLEGKATGANSVSSGALPDSAPGKPLSAWKVEIRNMVNGLAVVRPENLTGADTWGLQYTLNPLSKPEARRHYTMCKNRRKSTLEAPQDTDAAATFYLDRFIRMSRSGAQWRQRFDELDAGREQVVLYNQAS